MARRIGCVAAFLAAMVWSGSAAAGQVALTFDDLPTMSLGADPAYARATTRELLSGLRRHHLPAIGFVIGENLEGPERAANIGLLNAWMDAGMQLGNHTYSHESLNKIPVRAYVADVARADALLRPVLAGRHQTLRWFRHPYLETGMTPEVRRTFEAWLATHGYRVAPVTMENSDYVFATPYDDAILRHDTAAAARVKQAYLDYTAQTVAWYGEAGKALLGRRPAYVFLLHATRLNADCIDQLAMILSQNDLHAVSLDRAMRDPAYRIADHYAGPDGDEWLSRWSRTLRKELPWDDFKDPPADMVAEDARLDPAP